MQRKKVGAAFAVVCFGTIALLFWHGSQPAEGQSRSTQKQTKKKPLAADDVETESSRVYIHVGKTGFGHRHAIAGQIKSGQIHLGASQNAGKIVFDMTSFVAGTVKARRYIGLKGNASASTARKVTANMLGKDILNVRQFPTATFTVSSALPLKKASADGHPQYLLDGKFTLHGVTQPLKFTAEANEKGGTIRLRGGFRILQSSFGMTPYTTAFGTIGVADRLTIYGEIDVVKDVKLKRQNRQSLRH